MDSQNTSIHQNTIVAAYPTSYLQLTRPGGFSSDGSAPDPLP